MTPTAFRWPVFLLAFIAAPLVFTLLTFWLMIPIWALLFGGPLYLVAGLPLAAWYLHRHPFHGGPVMILGQACQLLQIPVFVALAAWHKDWNMLEALPAFLLFGALFAALWTATFIGLYRFLTGLNARPNKEPHDVYL